VTIADMRVVRAQITPQPGPLLIWTCEILTHPRCPVTSH
jgi:hypothetical protein